MLGELVLEALKQAGKIQVEDPERDVESMDTRETSDPDQEDDRVVISHITETGFFGTHPQAPRVVLWDWDVDGERTGEWIAGGAFAVDVFTVMHAYRNEPPHRPVGMPMPCAFHLVSNEQLPARQRMRLRE